MKSPACASRCKPISLVTLHEVSVEGVVRLRLPLRPEPLRGGVRRARLQGDGSNSKIDIAPFETGPERTAENVRRPIECQKALKLGDRGAYKMRDHEQAAKDGLRELQVRPFGTHGIGFDPRGSTHHKRSPDGEESLEYVERVARIHVNGHFAERRPCRKKKVLDDDLPLIAAASREFRAKPKVPGT